MLVLISPQITPQKNSFNSTVTDLHEIWFMCCLGKENLVYLKFYGNSTSGFRDTDLYNFDYLGIKGVSTKIQTPISPKLLD